MKINKLLQKFEYYVIREEVLLKTKYGGIFKFDEGKLNEEQLWLNREEYARVMSTLETWLKTSPRYKNEPYIWKEIQTSDNDVAYVYTFQKVKKDYIVIRKKEVL